MLNKACVLSKQLSFQKLPLEILFPGKTKLFLEGMCNFRSAFHHFFDWSAFLGASLLLWPIDLLCLCTGGQKVSSQFNIALLILVPFNRFMPYIGTSEVSLASGSKSFPSLFVPVNLVFHSVYALRPSLPVSSGTRLKSTML